MAREADYDVDLFAEMARSGAKRDDLAQDIGDDPDEGLPTAPPMAPNIKERPRPSQ